MISDSNIVRKYLCEGCAFPVVVRRTIIPFGPKKGTAAEITYGCRCEDLRIAEDVLRNKERLEKEKLLQLFDQNSLINNDLKESRFETYVPANQEQKAAQAAAERFVHTFALNSPQNLLFTGTYGLGKSHLAAAILKEVLALGHSGIFTSVPKLLSKLKATYSKNSEHSEDELLTALEKTDCLVLDDIGAEHGSEHSGSWSTSKVFEIVDSRIGKHTIFTTNLNAAELQKKMGQRNFSRMMHQTEVVTVKGSDYRLKQFIN